MDDVIETRNILWPHSSGAKGRIRCVAGRRVSSIFLYSPVGCWEFLHLFLITVIQNCGFADCTGKLIAVTGG
jgi:hypothetical protein